MFLRGGKNLENPEETHMYTGRTWLSNGQYTKPGIKSLKLGGINATVIGLKPNFFHGNASKFVQCLDTYLETY